MTTTTPRLDSRHPVAYALLLLIPLLLLLATPHTALAQEGAILSPGPGVRVSGVVEVMGFAQHPEFRKWQLDLLVDGNPDQAHFLALGEEPVWEGTPLVWFDSTAFPDGQHVLRLRVVHTNLNYDEVYSPIVIANGGGSSAFLGAAALAAERLPLEPLIPELQLPEPAAPPPPLIRTDVPAGERWISIDLSDQTLAAWQGGEVVFQTTVSTGKLDWETLPGEFAVYLKLKEAHMKGDDYDTPDVPWTMYYSGDFAIHGAYWHNDFGTPVSHGCVNMRVDEAKALFDWAAMGTRVVVTD